MSRSNQSGVSAFQARKVTPVRTWKSRIALCVDENYKQPLILGCKMRIIKWWWGFPGGAVVGSPPASAGDTGSSPGLGRSRMPRSS